MTDIRMAVDADRFGDFVVNFYTKRHQKPPAVP
jgi:hypothetical protein